ncbi:dipeptidase [Pseudomonas citronellolis]|nr:dipeptidase [Pseudomonas citronellolis]UXJ50857.1 dipeptidase [Pseudomonas citronellolis]
MGLLDVSQLPKITQRLLDTGYSEQDLNNIWSGNLLRVLDQMQRAADPAAVASCLEGG